MKTLVWLCLIALVVACKKSTPPDDSGFSATPGSGFYILNEGNFQWSNSSLSYADRIKDTVWYDLYPAVNGMGLGDVLQSGTIVGDQAYWVVNNSGKIVITDVATLELRQEINGLPSPRHFLWINDTIGMVTDLYANRLSMVNPATGSVSGTVALKGWTEQMIQVGNMVWVTNRSDDFIAVVDPFTATITDSIPVTYGSHTIGMDANGQVWVLCSGKNGVPPKLHVVDTASRLSTHTFSLPTSAPGKMCISADGFSVWLASSTAAYKMDITATTFPAQPLVTYSLNSMYGLSADQQSGVWLTDARDYVSPGLLYHLQPSGTWTDTLVGGLLPNGVLSW